MTSTQPTTSTSNQGVVPRAAGYDPVLTIDLPALVSVTRGMNAIAHAVEGLYAADRSPIGSMMACEGARGLLTALPRLVDRPDGLEARGTRSLALRSGTGRYHHDIAPQALSRVRRQLRSPALRYPRDRAPPRISLQRPLSPRHGHRPDRYLR